MRTNTEPSSPTIDIPSLWSLMRRSGPKIAAAALLTGLAIFGALALVAPRFASEAQLLIGGQGLNDRLRDPQLGTSLGSDVLAVKVDKEAVASQVIALRSRDVALKLVSELGLSSKAEFNSALSSGGIIDRVLRGLVGARSGESQEDRVLAAYYRALRVFQGKDTRVITIEFSSMDSEFAATAANRLAELYQEWVRSQSASQTADVGEWLKPQVEKLTHEVGQAESEVERFRGQANLFRGATQSSGLNEQQLADLAAEVIKARTARGEIEARARSGRELLQRGGIEAIPDVQKSPVIQSLIAQRVRAERDKAEAEAVLLPGHPRMKQLIANVTDLRRQVNREAATVVEGLEKEAAVAALREEIARKSLNEMKAQVGDMAGDVAKLAALESKAKAKRRELEALQASYEAARSRGDVKAVPLEAQIISRARPSGVPAYPKKLQLASLGAAATLVLGFVFVLTRELLTLPGQNYLPISIASAKSGLQSESMAAFPQLHVMPTSMPLRESNDGGRAGESDSVSAVTAARRLAKGTPAGRGHRTLVVGDDDDIDARHHAADLARELARLGQQVVLIDWSAPGEVIDVDFGVPTSPGLIDLIDGTASFEDVIRPMPNGKAHVIVGGSPLAGSIAHRADRLMLALDALEDAYAHVVVTGTHDALRELFVAVEARFDTAVVVTEPRLEVGESLAQSSNTLFGKAVHGVRIIRLDRGGLQPEVGRGVTQASPELVA